MDGLTLLAKLQEAEDKPSTIIVSAYGDMANIRTAMNRGAFDFLTKPIDFADLETTIEQDAPARGGVARGAAAADRGRASACVPVALLLAEPRRAAGRRCRRASNSAAQRREVASLFTDIAGFTTLVESLDPAILAEILNEYFGEMTDVVFAHEGTVAKIVGDAIHVLFGAPGDQPDHAARAVDLRARPGHRRGGLSRALARARDRDRRTRIGVHAGPAIVGNFGGGRFFDYTAYGDTINTAARLEAANKAFGTRICVSEAVVDPGRAIPGPAGRATSSCAASKRRCAPSSR